MNRRITSPRSFSVDRLHSALHDVGGAARPDYLPDIVAQAGRTRQRPAWTFLERWLSVDITVGREGVPRAAVVYAALVLLVGLLAAAVAIVGSQATEDRQRHLPATVTFKSSIHGISIDHPSSWQTRPATEPRGRGIVAFGAPDVDTIFDPTLREDLYLLLASGPLRNPEPDHCCKELSPPEKICGGGHGTGSTTVDGARAYAGTIGRCQFARIATPTRNYAIYLYVGRDRLLATYDSDWFKAALDTVDLRPELAVDAP